MARVDNTDSPVLFPSPSVILDLLSTGNIDFDEIRRSRLGIGEHVIISLLFQCIEWSMSGWSITVVGAPDRGYPPQKNSYICYKTIVMKHMTLLPYCREATCVSCVVICSI